MSASFCLKKVVPRTFTLKDLIPAATPKHKSLIEMIAPYPTRGIGFRVRKSDWAPGNYFVLTDVKLENSSEGELEGEFYEQGQKVGNGVTTVHGATERGDWEYELGDSECMLDNGLRYNTFSMKQFWEDETTQKPVGANLCYNKDIFGWEVRPEMDSEDMMRALN